MRRRPLEDVAPPPPPEPLQFDPAAWPAGYDDFREARLAHLERHGWPGGTHAEIASLPDEPWTEGLI